MIVQPINNSNIFLGTIISLWLFYSYYFLFVEYGAAEFQQHRIFVLLLPLAFAHIFFVQDMW